MSSDKIPERIEPFTVPSETLSTAVFHGVVIVATTCGVYVYDGVTLQKIEPFNPEQKA